MYYDARCNSSLNGMFNIYTFEKLKGYYPFYLFSKLYKLGTHVKAVSDTEDIYAVAAKNDENFAIMLSYFTNDENAEEKEVTLKFDCGGAEEYSMLLLDDTHDAENVGLVQAWDGVVTVSMSPNTVILLEK